MNYSGPFAGPIGEHTLRVRSTDNAGLVETVKELALKVRQVTSGDGGVVGDVPPTLALTLGTAASFGTFTPGVAREYTAATTANVVSTAGDATLSVADPSSTNTGHLVNGSFVMPQALQIAAGASAFRPIGGASSPTALLNWGAPVSNEQVTINLKQVVAANDALRTGAYSKTLTFTLSTTTP